ncbi:hypothetical protein RJ639_021258 [Escallonia herrerae]|uniref:phosphatidylglycerophosphatase n=1 Tax=Escallonia herrerae TaxID=1293975 RepID=A0AA89AHH2_9ASTE|nr:hypothetical protein RJ639_021258 [Escallonia herrerae]
MYIEEIKEEESENAEQQVLSGDGGGILVLDAKRVLSGDGDGGGIVVLDAKRVLVGAGARALFYPTLLYNVVRNKIQAEFHWWDRVDQYILLGAVPFPTDVPRLKELGVCGVVTLNEPYETLVPTSLFHAHSIEHLVIPTRDYVYAPSYGHICLAVDFIHGNASYGKTTYVHCKAGRGRSTTIVLCYLVEHKRMTPHAAYEYVRSIRPRIHLASSQWQAVQDYYLHRVKRAESNGSTNSSVVTSLGVPAKLELGAFDDGSVVFVSELDLDGYDESCNSGIVGRDMLAELSLACRVQFASEAAIARLSCMWLRSHASPKMSRKKLGSPVGTDQLGTVGVDIQVY